MKPTAYGPIFILVLLPFFQIFKLIRSIFNLQLKKNNVKNVKIADILEDLKKYKEWI